MKTVLIILVAIWLLAKISGCPIYATGRDRDNTSSPTSTHSYDLRRAKRAQWIASIHQDAGMHLRVAAVKELARRRESPQDDLQILLRVASDGRMGARSAISMALQQYAHRPHHH